MRKHALTLGELRDAISDFIEAYGEGTPVALEIPDNGYDPQILMDAVYIGAKNEMLGYKADNYEPPPNITAYLTILLR